MSGGEITFTLIVAAELIALFRLLLPSFLAFAEDRYQQVYGDQPFICQEMKAGANKSGRGSGTKGADLLTGGVSHKHRGTGL